MANMTLTNGQVYKFTDPGGGSNKCIKFGDFQTEVVVNLTCEYLGWGKSAWSPDNNAYFFIIKYDRVIDDLFYIDYHFKHSSGYVEDSTFTTTVDGDGEVCGFNPSYDPGYTRFVAINCPADPYTSSVSEFKITGIRDESGKIYTVKDNTTNFAYNNEFIGVNLRNLLYIDGNRNPFKYNGYLHCLLGNSSGSGTVIYNSFINVVQAVNFDYTTGSGGLTYDVSDFIVIDRQAFNYSDVYLALLSTKDPNSLGMFSYESKVEFGSLTAYTTALNNNGDVPLGEEGGIGLIPNAGANHVFIKISNNIYGIG